jgi:uncharacterized membrane protein YczE
MTALVNLLPKTWQSRAKAIATVVGIILAAVVVAVPVLPKWAILPVAFLTTFLAHQTPAPGYVAPGDVAPTSTSV